MNEEITLRDLRNAAVKTPQQIGLDLLILNFAPDYSAFVGLVERALDWATQEFARNPQFLIDMSEDQLTFAVIRVLKAMGFDASHQMVGGHCDVVIDGPRDFLWLGEAKIHRDYEWLFKGFEQLNTRYSTGAAGQNVGGMIIYCKQTRLDQVMDKWAQFLSSKVQGISIAQVNGNSLTFNSEHTHDRTGLKFRVRHMPVSVVFEPRDRKIGSSNKAKGGLQ